MNREENHNDLAYTSLFRDGPVPQKDSGVVRLHDGGESGPWLLVVECLNVLLTAVTGASRMLWWNRCSMNSASQTWLPRLNMRLKCVMMVQYCWQHIGDTVYLEPHGRPAANSHLVPQLLTPETDSKEHLSSVL